MPLAKAAARVMLGASIAELRVEGLLPAAGDSGHMPHDAPISVKEAVLPFGRFRTKQGLGVDSVLGPEMKSTGEVMGIDAAFGTAFAKSQAAAYGSLPTKGRVFVSVANRDKRSMIFPVKRLQDLGFEVVATEGTAEVLRRNGVTTTVVGKHSEGRGDDVVPLILDGSVDLVINTPQGVGPRLDGYEIRAAAVARGVPCITTIQGAAACVQGIEALVRGEHRGAVAAGAPRRAAPVGRGGGALMPLQVQGEVLSVRRVGAYHAMTVVAPGIPELTRPGHFLAVQVGGPESSMLLRRAFAIHEVRPTGLYGGTVEVVFAVHGRGTAWLAERRQGDPLDVVGPLGKPFRLPREAVTATLVGGGYGAAPLLPLAAALRERGCAVDMVLGAGGADRLFGALEAKRMSRSPRRHHRRRLRGRARAGLRRAAPAARADRQRRRLRLRADGDAARRRRAGRRGGHPVAGGGGGVDGLRHRGLHDVRAAGGRGRRPYPDGALVRGGTGVPRRPGALAGRGAGPRRRGGSAPMNDPRTADGRPVDMTTRLAGVAFPNPVFTASGCAAAGSELDQFFDVTALGGVVTKSIMLEARSGRATPRMAETPSGMLNSIGLQGPGVDAFLDKDLAWLADRGARAVVSIAGGSVEDYGRLAAKLRGRPGLTMVEVNISCPNVEDRGQVFACDPRAASEVVEAVRRNTAPGIPVFAKLSPDVTDITAVARACVAAGADGLSVINTLLGLAIDTTTLRPVLGGVTGGLSGPAIRPVAVRCVWQVHQALPDVPVLGMGGIRTGLDALEFVLAGASAVSVGTTVFGDPTAPLRVLKELEAALAERGFARFSDAVGLAHRPPDVVAAEQAGAGLLPDVGPDLTGHLPEGPDPVGDTLAAR